MSGREARTRHAFPAAVRRALRAGIVRAAIPQDDGTTTHGRRTIARGVARAAPQDDEPERIEESR